MLKITPETPIAALTVGQFTELFYSNTKTNNTRIESQQSESLPKIFGVKGLKKLTGYSGSSIYHKTSKKIIPHFKRDGMLLFNRDEIFAWMTENRIKTQSEFIQEMDQKFAGRKTK